MPGDSSQSLVLGEIDGPLGLIWANSASGKCQENSGALWACPAPTPQRGQGPACPEPRLAPWPPTACQLCVQMWSKVGLAPPTLWIGDTARGQQAALLGLTLILGFGIWNPLLRRLGSHSGMRLRGRPGQETQHPARLLWAGRSLGLSEAQLPSQ